MEIYIWIGTMEQIKALLLMVMVNLNTLFNLDTDMRL